MFFDCGLGVTNPILTKSCRKVASVVSWVRLAQEIDYSDVKQRWAHPATFGRDTLLWRDYQSDLNVIDSCARVQAPENDLQGTRETLTSLENEVGGLVQLQKVH